ncbi:MAG: 2-methylcitrate dehydratase PrpD, partial [Gammaproteobacteria bacterium]
MSIAHAAPVAAGASTVTATFADFAISLDGTTLPTEVRRKAGLCLLDFLAACLRARELEWSRQALELVRRGGSRADATLIGTDLQAAATEAAFANATAGHGLIREDMHVASACHIGVVVIPAALAVAEREGASGADLLAAIVAGYEITARLGRAVLSQAFAAHFRPTGTIGPFGAALAAARLAALSRDETVAALGFAGNLGAGLNEWPWSGGTEIYFHAGNAARAGVQAADLGAIGALASATIVEGAGGLLAAHDAAERASMVTDGLGLGFEIMQVAHKPAPSWYRMRICKRPIQRASLVRSRFTTAMERSCAVRWGMSAGSTRARSANASGPKQGRCSGPRRSC